MRTSDRIYVSLTKLLPRIYVNYFEHLMKYAGEQQKAMMYLGSSLLLSVLVFVIVFVSEYYYTTFNMLIIILSSLLASFVVQLIHFLIIYFKMEARAEIVESSLPDQLQLMANNIKSGMTPYHALRMSIREEFGALSEEISKVTSKTMSSKSFTDALLDIRSRIKSVMLERVLKLESSSFKKGAKLTVLLNDLAEDIRQTRALRRELLTKTKTYVAFIMFTVLVGTPVLLSISIHFVTMIQGFASIVPSPGSANDLGIGFFTGSTHISVAFLEWLSYGMLLMTTVLASMLLGVFNSGRPISGLKYAPVLMIAAVAIFTGARYFVTSFFGTMT